MAEFRYTLTLNGLIITIPFNVTQSSQKYRIDSFKLPGKEFEQLRYQGRELATVRIDFSAYNDSQGRILDYLIDFLSPALSDTGLRTQTPPIITVEYYPITRRKMDRFIAQSDDAIALVSPGGSVPKKSWGISLMQWVQWKGPGVPTFADANDQIGASWGNMAVVAGPTVATTSDIATTNFASGKGGHGQAPGVVAGQIVTLPGLNGVTPTPTGGTGS